MAIDTQIRPTPLIPSSEGIFTIYGSSIIDRPGDQIFRKILDVTNYKNWNTFSPEVSFLRREQGDSIQIGDQIRLKAHIRGDSPVPNVLWRSTNL